MLDHMPPQRRYYLVMVNSYRELQTERRRSERAGPSYLVIRSALKSIDAARTKLKQAIFYIERNPETVKSITSFPYMQVILMWKGYEELRDR